MKTTLNYLVLACLVTGIIMLNGCKKEPDPISLPTVVTSSVSEITLNTAIVKGMVIAEGGAVVTARGICWNTAPKPTINDSRTTDGAGFGAFTSNITSLSPNTTYHVRAYAINSEGIRYGDDLTFHTKQGPPILLATIITMDISSVTSTSAFSGGNITDNGGDQFTVSGVCWSTVQNPSVNDSETFPESGSAVFTSIIYNLTPNTTYYVRAYATNSAGTAYGNELSFITLAVSPILFNDNLTYGSASDIDGNEYKTIQIGTQEWMAENLKTTKYNDGNSIPNVTNIIEWSNLTTGAYCWYNNVATANKAYYGALYNWYAVSTNKLCPAGWHVPTDAEWIVLITYLGGESIAGGKLMETGTTHWLNPDSKVTNESGFTGLPGGFRYSDDSFGHAADYIFDAIGGHGFWWSNSEYMNLDAWIFYISSWGPSFTATTDVTTIIKNGGMSVRCVKD